MLYQLGQYVSTCHLNRTYGDQRRGSWIWNLWSTRRKALDRSSVACLGYLFQTIVIESRNTSKSGIPLKVLHIVEEVCKRVYVNDLFVLNLSMQLHAVQVKGYGGGDSSDLCDNQYRSFCFFPVIYFCFILIFIQLFGSVACSGMTTEE